jgi:FMN reductase (NADPH)
MELEKSMENPTLDLIHRHASVRRYKADPLPASIIEAIVTAGQRASTSSNLQTYSVVSVTDPTKRARLSELCGGQKHVAEAPVFLTFCADLARLERVCQLRGYTQVVGHVENFLVAAVDAAILAQNTALAAESLGLGICYIGSIRNNLPQVIDLLELPRLVVPITGMTVGWPDVEPRLRPRLPLRAVLHWEKYDTTGEDGALREYDRAMIATGIYKGRQVPVPVIETETEDYGWMEQSARRVSQPARTDLSSVLEKQGFGLE